MVFQRFRRGGEENAVNNLLVLKSNCGNLFRDCEHDVKVRHLPEVPIGGPQSTALEQATRIWGNADRGNY